MQELQPVDLIREIRAEMARQGTTGQRLAAAADMHPNTLSRRFQNPSALTLGEMRRLCGALGISVEALFQRARSAA